MEKTDRQTDTTARGSAWLITAYNDEILKCEQSSAYPTFVTAIHGGREMCPTTGKEHFQGAILTKQIRFSQLKSWLPTAHIELAQSKDAVMKYAMKQETSIGAKVIRENDKKFYRMEELLQLLGYYELTTKSSGLWQEKFKGYADKVINKEITISEWTKQEYWFLVKQVLQGKGAYLIASYSKGDIFSAWSNLRDYWLVEALSITEPPDQKNEIENEIISPA